MKTLLLTGMSIALAACAKAPDLATEDVLAPATNARSQIRHVHDPSVLTGYTSRAIKGPQDWRKLNEQQSPNKQEES